MTKRITTYARRLALFWLMLNVCVVSIPRCDALFSYWIAAEHNHAGESCHDSRSDPHRPAIKDGHICQCSLLSFVFAPVQWMDPLQVIEEPPSSPVLLTFSYRDNLREPHLDVDPPRPKFG